MKKATLLKEVNGEITERIPLEFDEEGIARINIDDLYENFAPEYTPGEGIANYTLIGEIETGPGYTVKSRLACLVYPTDDEGNDIVSSGELNVCSCSGYDKVYDKSGKCVYGEEE